MNMGRSRLNRADICSNYTDDYLYNETFMWRGPVELPDFVVKSPRYYAFRDTDPVQQYAVFPYTDLLIYNLPIPASFYAHKPLKISDDGEFYIGIGDILDKYKTVDIKLGDDAIAYIYRDYLCSEIRIKPNKDVVYTEDNYKSPIVISTEWKQHIQDHSFPDEGKFAKILTKYQPEPFLDNSGIYTDNVHLSIQTKEGECISLTGVCDFKIVLGSKSAFIPGRFLGRFITRQFDVSGSLTVLHDYIFTRIRRLAFGGTGCALNVKVEVDSGSYITMSLPVRFDRVHSARPVQGYNVYEVDFKGVYVGMPTYLSGKILPIETKKAKPDDTLPTP